MWRKHEYGGDEECAKSEECTEEDDHDEGVSEDKK